MWETSRASSNKKPSDAGDTTWNVSPSNYTDHHSIQWYHHVMASLESDESRVPTIGVTSQQAGNPYHWESIQLAKWNIRNLRSGRSAPMVWRLHDHCTDITYFLEACSPNFHSWVVKFPELAKADIQTTPDYIVTHFSWLKNVTELYFPGNAYIFQTCCDAF